MTCRRGCAIVPAAMWLVVCVHAGEPTASLLDPNLPYKADKSNPVTYQVDFSIVVTAPYQTKLLKVWIPIPPSDAGQEVTRSEHSSFPMRVVPQIAAEPEYQNRFAYFEFPKPQGAQSVRHKFQVRVWELRWRIDEAKIDAVRDWPSGFDSYRKGDTQAVVVDQRFHDLLPQAVTMRLNPHADLMQVLGWVQRNFEYDHTSASLRASAEHALVHRRGHCSDYHSFCASMGRVLGYPTRVTYGINPFPKNSPSHCKLESFLPPYGWVSFDVSETQKLATLLRAESRLDAAAKQRLINSAQRRLASGFRDNTWYLQTRGTDYELAPKASRRVPVVRTAYIEADGVPLREPDPADTRQREFSWMTVHEYVPDRPVTYPFADWKSLQTEP